MQKIIEAVDLSFGYGSVNFLDEISFSICGGDFVSIIGANGSGKSTLLKLMLGRLMPVKGEIRLFGKSTADFKEWTRIGYIPQNYSSLSGFPATAEEVVRTSLFSKVGLMRFPKKEHKQAAIKALELVGMGDCAGKLIGNLSGGQLQRVMIARVLAGEPSVLILDEPASGIDANAAESLYGFLHKLNNDENITVIMVTHDIKRVSAYSNRILCVEDGSLVELDHVQLEDELRHRHKHPVKEVKGDGHFSV